MTDNNTPTTNEKQKQKQNKNTECGEEETFEGNGLGFQVCSSSRPRLPRAASAKISVKKYGRSSRDASLEKTPAEKMPVVCLERVEVVNFGVKKTGSAYILTTRGEGEPPPEKVSAPQPSTSGLGLPQLPARDEAARTVGAVRDVSLASTVMMDSRRNPADEDVGPVTSEDDMDVETTDDVDVVTGEPRTEKRGRGRPPTTGEYVGWEERKREMALQKKEEDKVRRAEEALSSSLPKGNKWKWVLRTEADLEDEISQAPTEDIASRLVEQSTIIFKIASCSNAMKGDLVRKLQESVALVRAATSVMTLRAREAQGGRNSEELLRTIRELRAENGQLRREIEEIKSRLPPPTNAPCASAGRGRRSAATKRRRVVDSTDSGEEAERSMPPSLTSLADFPPLRSQRKMGRREDRGGETPRKDRSGTDTGLTLGGVTRQVDMYPPGLEEGNRAEHDALLAALTPVLERLNLQHNEGRSEYREIWEQINAIKGKLASLRGEDYIPPPMPPVPTAQDPPRLGGA